MDVFVGARLRGRVGKFYGITMLYRKNPKPFRKIFRKYSPCWRKEELETSNQPASFPLLEARHALEFLASGSAEGKIVLSVDAS